uniref:Acyl-CoA thioesterase n=1 Tax=Haemonchus contortus TaxID=6289 RepID=A0A7I4YY80_HAECO
MRLRVLLGLREEAMLSTSSQILGEARSLPVYSMQHRLLRWPVHRAGDQPFDYGGNVNVFESFYAVKC